MIDREHELPLTRQATLVGISRSAVYYQAVAVSERDLALMRRIDELHLEQPFWGSRGLLRMLRRDASTKPWIEQQALGRKHVATLMRRMGIEAQCPKPGTSRKGRGPRHKVFPYLLGGINFEQMDANTVWALDTTYIPMRHGFAYLTAVIDVASRRVLAHKLCTTLEAYHAVEIIEQAINRFGTPEIVNTDQGSQFTAVEFVETITKRAIKLSMDGKGAWRDNVFVERFWRTIKYERVYKRAYDTVSQARNDVAEYIDWYNDSRPHTSNERDKTPTHAYDDSRTGQAQITLRAAA
jgi:putative transposase